MADSNNNNLNKPKVPKAPNLGSPNGGVKVPKRPDFVPPNSADAKALKKQKSQIVKSRHDSERQAEKQRKQTEQRNKKEQLEIQKEIAKQEKQKQQELKEQKKARRLQEKQQSKIDKLQQKQDGNSQEKKKKKKAAPVGKAEKPATKDFKLDDLKDIESSVLGRYNFDTDRLKRVISILTMLLVFTLASAAFLYFLPDGEDKPKPVDVHILTEVTNIELLELIDPENPDLGFQNILLYPGDTFGVELHVTNLPNIYSFPVFVRYRAYIVYEEQTYHGIYIPNFYEDHLWHNFKDEEGHIIGDGYSYYEGMLNSYESVQILQELTLSKTNLDDFFQGHTMTLVLQVETIQADLFALDETESWYTAPQSWKDYYTRELTEE